MVNDNNDAEAFLVEDAGVNSGFMIAQVTAAALASENKSRAHPASVDSLPTSANQEDHVSMAAYAARRLERMNRNLSTIIGVELMCAAQGIEFRAPLKTSPSLAKAVKEIRAVIPTLKEDRYQADDIARASELVSKGSLVSQLGIDGYVVGVTA